MRRSRSLREFRNELIKKRAKSISGRRKKVNQRILQKKNKFAKKEETVDSPDKIAMHEKRRKVIQKARQRMKQRSGNKETKRSYAPAACPSKLKEFKDYDSYQPTKLVNVLHIIDSVGMGGAQTMMMELVNGLGKYYGDHINNYVIVVGKDRKIKRTLFSSYGVNAVGVSYNKLHKYCLENEVDIVLHHRTATARSLKRDIPAEVKYILLNHTWNSLNRIREFHDCDYFVSVCNFLHKKTKWEHFIHSTRKIVIVNGVESDYIDDLPKKELPGSFKTGRCHRLVGSKFRSDSLTWFAKKAPKVIHGITHFLIGVNADARRLCGTAQNLVYYGPIDNRQKKMAIIKEWDLYFYETFAHEGASMAILESLACGVPVICNTKGGNAELVRHGVNGFIVADRSESLLFMQQMSMGHMNATLRKSTKKDFDKRLHIRHTACKYMQLFECVIDEVRRKCP